MSVLFHALNMTLRLIDGILADRSPLLEVAESNRERQLAHLRQAKVTLSVLAHALSERQKADCSVECRAPYRPESLRREAIFRVQRSELCAQRGPLRGVRRTVGSS